MTNRRQKMLAIAALLVLTASSARAQTIDGLGKGYATALGRWPPVTLLSRIDTSTTARQLLAPLMMSTVFTSIYDTATPLGTDVPSSIDDQIRNTKAAVQERSNVDHYWPLTGTQVSDTAAGEHRQISFFGPISTPTNAVDKGFLYIKDFSAKVELTWEDEDGDELQLTDGGTLNIVEADLLGTLTNDAWFTAIDAAGTGTGNLIRLTSEDLAQLPVTAVLQSTAAPTLDQGIANKKYVDDQVSALGTFTPTSYAGGESVTFPNGLIMKQGLDNADAGGSFTKTFAAAFPTAFLVGFTTGAEATATIVGKVTDTTVNAMTVRGSPTKAYHWQAWGY